MYVCNVTVRTLPQAFSSEFSKHFENSYFSKLWATASAFARKLWLLLSWLCFSCSVTFKKHVYITNCAHVFWPSVMKNYSMILISELLLSISYWEKNSRWYDWDLQALPLPWQNYLLIASWKHGYKLKFSIQKKGVRGVLMNSFYYVTVKT